MEGQEAGILHITYYVYISSISYIQHSHSKTHMYIYIYIFCFGHMCLFVRGTHIDYDLQ